MGFNLGAFAGGMAQGITTQQKFQQDQQRLSDEKNFRDRQLGMQEKDQAWQEEQRDRQRKMEGELKDVYDRHFGVQDVQTGTSVQDDGQGGTVQIPMTKKVTPAAFGTPGSEARDLAFMTDSLAIKMKHTTDPGQLTPIFDYLEKARGTQVGKDVILAMNGDQDKLGALVKSLGGDPSTAKVDRDKLTLDLGNGKNVDLHQYLLLAGADKVYTALMAQRKDQRQDKVTDAQVANLGATTEHTKALTKDVVPAQAANLRAEATYRTARAGAVDGNGVGVPPKVTKAVQDAVKGVIEKDDKRMAQFVQGYAEQLVVEGKGKVGVNGAASQAARAYNKAREIMKDFKKSDEYKKLKTKPSDDQLMSDALEKGLGIKLAPIGKPAAVDDEDDE